MQISVKRLLQLAKRHSQNGSLPEAEQLFRFVLNKFPKNTSAQKGLIALSKTQARGPSQLDIDRIIATFQQGQLENACALANELTEKFPEAFVLHNLLGAANANMGHIKLAITHFRQAIKIIPISAEAHNNLGHALMTNNALREAIESYHHALQINPTYAAAHYNLGIAYANQGNVTAAIKSWEQAIEINPSYADAYNNLGNAHNNIGNSQRAIECYRKALEHSPNDPLIHNNLGIALRKTGDLISAINCYQHSLTIKPNSAQTLNNLGVALGEKQLTSEAIHNLGKAITLEPHRTDFWQNLSVLLRNCVFAEYTDEAADVFLRLLDKKTIIRPKDIVRPIVALLKLHPKLKLILNSAATDIHQNLLTDVCQQLSRIPLFLRIIELCPIPDIEIERLLMSLRRGLLMHWQSINNLDELLNFQTALALHCFTNEFVYFETNSEKKAIDKLVHEIANEHSFSKPYKLAILASYRPLHSYSWSSKYSGVNALHLIYRRQVQEPNEEKSLLSSISRLKEITNSTSSDVREQYETHPYPRWINTQLFSEAYSITEVCKQLYLKLEKHSSSPQGPEILVAGCGTGQHPLSSATRFANSKVLAVDLSLSSLSYAIRKTRELSVKNITYMQADILDLNLLGKKFDLIESVGVLHHMATPIVGWKVLSDCLKPNGLMKIGLYSELARQHIVETRNRIAELGLAPDRDTMLAFRNDINNSTDNILKQSLQSSDYYSTSSLRDLLFHVQEHRFSLPQIKNCLNTLGLTFIGFEFPDESTLKLFKERSLTPGAIYNLDAWTEFESVYPNSFKGMYQFWVQKKS